LAGYFSCFVLLFASIAASQDPIETVRIDTDLVDLKVSVLGFPTNTPPPLLEPKDFVVLEDGVAQEISFFQAADTPFDLVLLLDLSGSNSKNLKMIRNSAKRFVDAARDIDRIALVTFTDQPALYSGFSLDRRKLKKTIDEMDEAIGGTNFWDSMDYVLRDLIPQGSGLRRSAIVVMTDGIDNALPDVPGPGSRLKFDELIVKNTKFGKHHLSDLPRHRRREREALSRAACRIRAGPRTACTDRKRLRNTVLPRPHDSAISTQSMRR
jgi:VWFA-related protein